MPLRLCNPAFAIEWFRLRACAIVTVIDRIIPASNKCDVSGQELDEERERLTREEGEALRGGMRRREAGRYCPLTSQYCFTPLRHTTHRLDIHFCPNKATGD